MVGFDNNSHVDGHKYKGDRYALLICAYQATVSHSAPIRHQSWNAFLPLPIASSVFIFDAQLVLCGSVWCLYPGFCTLLIKSYEEGAHFHAVVKASDGELSLDDCHGCRHVRPQQMIRQTAPCNVIMPQINRRGVIIYCNEIISDALKGGATNLTVRF